jgi:hypothetical protein
MPQETHHTRQAHTRAELIKPITFLLGFGVVSMSRVQEKLPDSMPSMYMCEQLVFRYVILRRSSVVLSRISSAVLLFAGRSYKSKANRLDSQEAASRQ